jgi:hypothetical protein
LARRGCHTSVCVARPTSSPKSEIECPICPPHRSSSTSGWTDTSIMQLFALGIAASMWGVVCFAFGFVSAECRRLANENTTLRSSLSALSCAPSQPSRSDQRFEADRQPESIHEQSGPLASTQASAQPLRHDRVVQHEREAVATQSHPPPHKTYLFGDPHAELLEEAPSQQPLWARTAQSSPSPRHTAPFQVSANGADLLPRRPQGRRELLRRRP